MTTSRSCPGRDATSARVLSALDGAWLAHIAAHGTFRADSPLFSSLRLHDGPLTVYDFEQLHRAPYRLILSSCDSGVLAPVGADELLGLVSSLLPLGTAGIVAGVVPLNDYAAVPLMVGLHQHLRAGQSLAEAMCSVRQGITGDLDPASGGHVPAPAGRRLTQAHTRPAGLQRDPPGDGVDARSGPAPQAERARRDGLDREAADLVGGQGRLGACARLNPDHRGLGRDDLAEHANPG